jgi:hypothetical protein
MIPSELIYLLGGKIISLKCRDLGGVTGSIPTFRDFCVVRPVAMVPCPVEPDREPTWQFVPGANAMYYFLENIQETTKMITG